jgi:hypothetical protein
MWRMSLRADPRLHVEINAQLAAVLADQMPVGSLPVEAVANAASRSNGLLDRLLSIG